MAVRIKTRWTDDNGDGPPRFYVIVNGQDCGPPVKCELEAWMLMRPEIESMMRHACDRAYGFGAASAQQAIKQAIGIK